jgi:hypothetical protein
VRVSASFACSFLVREIISEIKNLVKRDYKEIWLLGQNVNSYKYDHIDFPNLLKMINDKYGLGHRFCFNRVDNPLPNQVFDIALILFEWAQLAKPKNNDPFFSWNNGSITLSSNDINLSIKSIARHFGLNDKKFSSKSLRIGGASVLAAANVPDYIIQTMGRWKSLVFLQYIRLSTAALNKAVTIMSDISTFTSIDLTHMSASATILYNDSDELEDNLDDDEDD